MQIRALKRSKTLSKDQITDDVKSEAVEQVTNICGLPVEILDAGQKEGDVGLNDGFLIKHCLLGEGVGEVPSTHIRLLKIGALIRAGRTDLTWLWTTSDASWWRPPIPDDG